MINLRTVAWALGLLMVIVVIAYSTETSKDLITTVERENVRQLQVLNGRLGVQYLQTKSSLEQNAAQINSAMDKFRTRCAEAKQDFDPELIVCKDKPKTKDTVEPSAVKKKDSK